MKTTNLTLENIDINDDFDVIVIGGGPAGCTAAIAASKNGAKTLLVEATNALGGMGTMGLVPNWCPFTDRNEVIYKGIGFEIFTRAKKGMKYIKQTDLDWVAIDPEHLKTVYDDICVENNVTVLFGTILSAAQVDDNKCIDYVVLSNKAG